MAHSLARRIARKPVVALYLYSAMMAISIGLAVFAVIDRAEIRSENRRAIQLVALTQCRAAIVLRDAALKQAKTDAQVERTTEFFSAYVKPTNEALVLLGKPPCVEERKAK